MNRFELKHIPLFHLISIFCVNAIENENSEICRSFYAVSSQYLLCEEYNRTKPHNFKSTVILNACSKEDYGVKRLDTHLHFQYYNNLLCSLRPYDFLFLESQTEIEQFLSSSKTRVLQNNTFYGVCKSKVIDLDESGIEIIESGAFDCVQSIHRLNLRHNKIETLPRDTFKEMRGLVYLLLDSNRIHTFPPGIFDNLVCLKILHLGNNLISYLPDAIFSQLSLLEDLRLYNNKLVNLSSLLLSNLLQLKDLYLNNNQLKSLSNSFSNNRNLDRISISQNVDLNLTADAFVGLENVYYLHMTRCNLKILPRDLFLGTPELQYLNLRGNRLQIISGEIFSPLKDLQEVHLDSNNITELRKSFQSNKKMRYINLNINKISRIEKDVFQGLSKLEDLFLSSNYIENIAEGSFNGLSNLTNLHLPHNFITSLYGNSSFQSILKNLTALQFLDLQKNRITYLKNVFVDNKKMQSLNISENPLILENDAFAGLVGLKWLYLVNCKMTSLPVDLFKNTPKLSHVYLSNNNFKEISAYTFRQLQNLIVLNITFGNISNLTDQPFEKQSKLESLTLKNNNLSEIKKTDFVGLSSVTFLDISENLITKIENNSFDGMRNLESLILNYNWIASFSSNHPFLNNAKLREIDVSYNKLTDIWSMNLGHLKHLEILKASNNDITEFLIKETYPEQMELVIRLEWNKIRYVYLDSKQIKNRKNVYESGKVHIYLEGNPLQCDCHMFHLYDLLHGSNFLPHVKFQDDLICKSPAEYKETLLNKLRPSDFMCDITDDCPDRCICTFRADTNTQSVNCSNQNYSNLPIEAPFNTSILYIKQNNLTSLLRLSGSLWENLTEIYADDNIIKSEEFVIPKKLKFLSLQHNKLESLPSTVKTHTENVRDFKIAISDNLWSCDCSLIVLKTWLLQHSIQVIDVNEVRCVFPNDSLSTVSFISVEDPELCPLMYLYGYLIGVVIALLFTSFLVFYYKYKLYILSFIYTHCNCLYTTFCCDRPSEEDKLFDCFISYSSEDRDVTLSVLEELEVKPPHYKFCIHERNWMPGRYITNNIILSVQSSRKTLIILSDSFLKSKWFQLEFDAAYQQTLRDKKNRLIIVLKGDLLDKSELSEDVAFVISWKTYLLWGEKWFWEKLRKAIFEDSPQKTEQNKSTLESMLSCFSRKSDQNEQDIPMSEDLSCEVRV